MIYNLGDKVKVTQSYIDWYKKHHGFVPFLKKDDECLIEEISKWKNEGIVYRIGCGIWKTWIKENHIEHDMRLERE